MALLLLNLALTALSLEVQGLICQKITVETIHILAQQCRNKKRSVSIMAKIKQIITKTLTKYAQPSLMVPISDSMDNQT